MVEDVVARAFDEHALFHLLNLAREDDAFLLLTSRVVALDWQPAIRDLYSRIKALPVISLSPPDDDILRAVLVKLFADRQLAIEENVIGYIASRIERSFASARSTVERLDTEAMRRKRPVTRALAAEILHSGSLSPLAGRGLG